MSSLPPIPNLGAAKASDPLARLSGHGGDSYNSSRTGVSSSDVPALWSTPAASSIRTGSPLRSICPTWPAGSTASEELSHPVSFARDTPERPVRPLAMNSQMS